MPHQFKQASTLAALLLGAGLCAAAAPEAASSARVRQLLSQMSRAEKMAVIRGAQEPAGVTLGQAGWTAGVPRLGIPDLRFADGPPGVLVRHPSTGMPSTLSMAATFSPADAEETGALIGRDARALGVDVILQPFINIYRDPTFERAYNTYGEDPVLTGILAARFVRGAQAQNVMAQAKHFVAYDAAAADVEVDGQALREIYAEPFRAVAQAGVASVMCSYNKVNGVHACGNASTLNGILRKESGFRGFVTSDWGATHGAEFIARGLDMEQPGIGPDAYFALGKEAAAAGMTDEDKAELVETLAAGVPEEQPYITAPAAEAPQAEPAGMSKNLGAALAKGSVTDADLDRAAGHVLGQMERFGWLDRAPNHTVQAQAVEANARAVQRLAERGAVLLKNDGVLPLKPSDLDSLALVGPGAQQTFAIVAGEEQSFGRAERQLGAYHALRAMGAGDGLRLAVADDMTGAPIPPQAFSGLVRIEGKQQAAAADIDHTLRSGRALPAGASAKWSGTLNVDAAGAYDIDLQLIGATGKFAIDGRKIGNMGWWGGHGDIVFANRDNVIPTTDGLDNVRRLVQLSAGPHRIEVEATADSSGAPVQVRLAWVTPRMKQDAFEAAVDAARRAKTAVVFAWARNHPAFGLPGEQDRLIEAVAAVNPNTVVVLNTGHAVAMPWLDKVRAVLEMWYTGDEGGWAAARLLTGRANPAGRLPITWPARLADGPANDPAHPERASKGVNGKTVYKEGIFVGYRWYDHQDLAPLFPFGFGLSYTSFRYSDLKLARATDGGLDASVVVKNTGQRDGDEVVQAYLGAPHPAPAGAAFAKRALASFDRITLAAGEERRVQLHIAPERLRYWSKRDQAWHDARDGRTVYIGRSSRDLPLSKMVSQ
ncbi:beta-glucosidase family protein [Massilia terrae]|uniref:Glycoside hydrolase family 3 C-terminal domain-containing protein n=1 Tax=Massilia terrae TaxID=1811224 RepID=A0ABT2CT34_9BURK|nr:glycoside hydrolase family 3 C-terminal domain-containing protein [Massilia terrae]